MRFANEYPLYRLLIPMVLGIIVAHFIKQFYISIGIVASLFLFVTFWTFRPSILRKYSWRFFSGLLISLLFFFLGYQLLLVKTHSNISNHYSHLDSISHFVVIINTPLIEREKTYKTVAEIQSAYIIDDTIAKKVTGKIILYFDKECRPALEYGDELLIANKLQTIKGFGNPNEFNYANYLKQQNIYHSVYLIRTDWIKTYHKSPNLLIQLSLDARSALLNILQEFHFSDNEFAVASAILLGYDEYLDQDLRQLYAGSGAMHILCVSGLHVGIIFLMFNTLLAFIKRFKYGDFIHAIIIILIIWIYAMITGLSPSVFRSATMFSFITVGTMMNRKASTYNSLAASAFVLLIYDPYLLFHIGFQLSYLAVLAILFIQPHISSLFYSKWWLFRKSWDLLAVSIAAQLGTFPLAIYYFHQFPNLFILTNLLVIPLSFIILIGGFANIFIYLIGSGTSYLGIIITKGLYYSLLFLNSSLAFINGLPKAVSSNLFFTISDTFLIYVLIIFLTVSIIFRRGVYLIWAIISLILLMGINVFQRYGVNQQEYLLIYHIPKHSAIDIISGEESILFCDSLLLNNPDKIKRYSNDYHMNKRIKKKSVYTFQTLDTLQSPYFYYSHNIIDFQGKSLLILDKKKLLPIKHKDHHFNYLLMRNTPKITLYALDTLVNFDLLIIDASNNYWSVRKWKKQCDSLNINYWDVKDSGAYIISTNHSE
jgi:competence protein ComEC